jgi:hypothetical protein
MAFHQKFVSVVIANLSGEKNGRGIGKMLSVSVVIANLSGEKNGRGIGKMLSIVPKDVAREANSDTVEGLIPPRC